MCSIRSDPVLPGRVAPFGNPRLKACLAAQRGLSQPYHVLHRPLIPRHPPRALSSLTHIKVRHFLNCLIFRTSMCGTQMQYLRSSVIKVRWRALGRRHTGFTAGQWQNHWPSVKRVLFEANRMRGR